MGISGITSIVANLIYLVLALLAGWGAYCVVMVWRRVAEKRFTSEQEQDEFMTEVERRVVAGDFASLEPALKDETRAVPQLALLAIRNRSLGLKRVRQLLLDRFQRDVLGDLESRLSWVNTVIKSAPMVGLLGTVMGMMGAFGKLAASENVRPDALAEDISVALITTASGLAIAIPLVWCTASINNRIRAMEDLVAAGLTRLLEAMGQAPGSKSGDGS